MCRYNYSLFERRDWRTRTIGLLEQLVRRRLVALFREVLGRKVLTRIGDIPPRQLEGLLREVVRRVAADPQLLAGVSLASSPKPGRT